MTQLWGSERGAEAAVGSSFYGITARVSVGPGEGPRFRGELAGGLEAKFISDSCVVCVSVTISFGGNGESVEPPK